jgi:hypothetical protein
MNRFRCYRAGNVLAGLALAALSTSPVMSDMPKYVVERPTKEVLAARSGAAAVTAVFDNPKVAPGRVSWHPTFAAACAASRASGKPVLLFQMMGNLDKQFC